MNSKPATHSLRFGDAVIEYTVRRSSRRNKTVEISVAGGAVLVSAPLRTPNREIQAIVRERGVWILDKLEASSQEAPPLRLVSGEALPCLGRELPLVVNDAEVRRPSARLDGERLRSGWPAIWRKKSGRSGRGRR